jgi:serine/threonine protein kinase
MRRITRALPEQPEEIEQLGQLQPGITLQGRYLILGVLGIGGMSSVYKGRDLHFPNVTKLVAIKEMLNSNPDPNISKLVVSNFEREADLLATLSHPAIPSIYDYFIHGNSAYLVMEFIDGKDLEAVIRDTDELIPEDQIIRWGLEICEVLSYLHKHKPETIVFRDMKPSNVMVDQLGHIRLIDFGIARFFEPGEKGTMIGTEGYSPPEQYRGEASPSGDIYALGATLHHLLTKRDPRAEAPFSFPERPIHKFNPNVSQELVDLIDISLAYDPEKRHADMEAMKTALLAVAKKTGAPVSSSDIPRPVGSTEVKEIWHFECEDEIRGPVLVNDGVVYIGCYDNNLYALDAKSGEFKWKFATEGGIPTRPAANEDIVFVASEDHSLYALSSNGEWIWSYEAEGPIRSSPLIEDRYIFFGSDDSYLHVVNHENGSKAWRAQADGPVRSTPLISNDRVYFGSETGDFYCLDFRGERKWRFRAKRGISSSPIIVDGLVYFGSLDWTVYALEAEGGFEMWRFRMGRPTISSPVFAEGMIFIGCADGHIYAIDARSSREKWRFQTDHQVTGSPVIHEDSLYCGSVDGSMYCLDIRSGRKRWQFTTGGPITGTPAICDSILVFGSTDHRCYALLT